MTAHELIADLHRRGVRLEIAADAKLLRWHAPDPLTVSQGDVDALRALKADVVDLLIERDERAAVMEIEGGMTRDGAERAAMDELAAAIPSEVNR